MDIGASHQTGWTGVVAALICLASLLTLEKLLEAGAKGNFDLLVSQPDMRQRQGFNRDQAVYPHLEQGTGKGDGSRFDCSYETHDLG